MAGLLSRTIWRTATHFGSGRHPLRSSPVLALLAGVVCGCGGSGGGDDDATPVVTLQKIAPPEDARDGWVRSDGVFSTSTCGGAGDLDNITNGLGSRVFLSFDLSVLPAGATLVQATVAVAVVGNLGNDPFNTHGGAPVVDHVNFGVALSGGDYSAGVLTADYGRLPQAGQGAIDRYRTLEVTSAVQADLTAGRVRSQFRLRFALEANNDGAQNLRLFQLADLACPTAPNYGLPLLILDYVP
jgi:hypothetical protein